jgi:hypothetical protein
MAPKDISVDITVSEIHASAIRKLDRNGSHSKSGDEPIRRRARIGRSLPMRSDSLGNW